VVGNKHNQIPDFPEEDEIIAQAAILYAGFKEIWPNIYPDIETSPVLVQHCFQSGNVKRIALDKPDIFMARRVAGLA